MSIMFNRLDININTLISFLLNETFKKIIINFEI